MGDERVLDAKLRHGKGVSSYTHVDTDVSRECIDFFTGTRRQDPLFERVFSQLSVYFHLDYLRYCSIRCNLL